MKKYAFDLAALILLIIDAVLWLCGILIEGFDFTYLIFLDILFLGWAALSIIRAFINNNVVRIYIGGLFFLAGMFTMFATFDLLIGFLPYLIIVVISIALTAVLALILRKGKKWDAGDNDKQ